MSEIKHDISIQAAHDTVYNALTTSQGLASWFTHQVQGSGKVGTNWQLSFTDEPFFSWRINMVNPNHIAWQCLEGPGNAPGTDVEFLLHAATSQQTTLTILHRGWQRDDPKYQRCVEIWRNLMNHLQHYCETGHADPAYH